MSARGVVDDGEDKASKTTEDVLQGVGSVGALAATAIPVIGPVLGPMIAIGSALADAFVPKHEKHEATASSYVAPSASNGSSSQPMVVHF